MAWMFFQSYVMVWWRFGIIECVRWVEVCNALKLKVQTCSPHTTAHDSSPLDLQYQKLLHSSSERWRNMLALQKLFPTPNWSKRSISGSTLQQSSRLHEHNVIELFFYYYSLSYKVYGLKCYIVRFLDFFVFLLFYCVFFCTVSKPELNLMS